MLFDEMTVIDAALAFGSRKSIRKRRDRILGQLCAEMAGQGIVGDVFSGKQWQADLTESGESTL